jgi:DNA-binding transcriptional LysR family regulator
MQPGLVARVLSRDPVIAVASPAYLAAHGTPRGSADLRQHRCLMGFGGRDVPESHWTFTGAGKPTKIQVDGTFFSNDLTLLCAAAVNGLGIAVLPMVLVRRFVEAGTLVQVLGGLLEWKSQLAVVYLEREFVPQPVRAFVDAAVKWAESDLPGPSDFDWAAPASPGPKRVRSRATSARRG